MIHLLKLLLLELLLLLVAAGGLHKGGHDVNRYREDNGAIVLRRYAIQSLKISELKREYFQCFCYKDE